MSRISPLLRFRSCLYTTWTGRLAGLRVCGLGMGAPESGESRGFGSRAMVMPWSVRPIWSISANGADGICKRSRICKQSRSVGVAEMISNGLPRAAYA